MSDAVEIAASAAPAGFAARREPRRDLTARIAGMRWPLPAAVAVSVAGCVLLALQLRPLIQALYRNADNAATLLLASNHPAGSLTKLGDHPFFEAWWFMRATAGLPGHVVLWQAAPFAVAFLGIAAVAGCAYLVAGRIGAVLAVAGLVAMSPPLRAVLLVPEARVGLPLHAAFLCGSLLLLDRWARAGRMTDRRWALAAAAVTTFTAAGVTDQLLIPAALAPYVLAALLGWWHDRSQNSRTLLTFALGTSAGAYGLAILLTRATAASGVTTNWFAVHLVPLTQLPHSAGVTFHLFAILGGGDLALGTPAGVLALLGLVGVCLWIASSARRPVARPLSQARATRLLYRSFWSAALLLTLGTVAVTSPSLDHAVFSAAQRYLLGAWVAFVALLAGLGTNRLRRNLLLVAVAAFGLLNLEANAASTQQPWEYGPGGAQRAALQRFVLAHHATVAYGSYWDVMPIGFSSGGRLRAIPIIELAHSGVWAGQFVVANSTWFGPHAGTRASFLVTDARNIPFAPHAPPASFGRAVAQARFGPLTVYVYPEDLARRLQGESG